MYIGEISRTFGKRFKEHLKAPSPIHDHSNTTGHTTSLSHFSIVGKEEQNLSRLIKESMFIRVNSPSLNKNIGKYHLLIYGMRFLLKHRTKTKINWPSDFSMCHQGNKICLGNIPSVWLFHLPQWQQHQPYQKIMWLFHLPQMVIISAITHVVIPSATIGNNISQHISGYSNCHTNTFIQYKW